MRWGRSRTSKATQQRHRRTRSCALQIEQLERREVFAVFLPDSFASNNLQPVGTAFNGGEQVFFGGHSDQLQFEFGSSVTGSAYAGSGWNQRNVDDLIAGSLDHVGGTPSLYTDSPSAGGVAQLHAVYRTTTESLNDVWASPWQSHTLVASGVKSDPTAVTLNGGRQVLYVGESGHVHIVTSADYGATWNDTDLTALVGLDGDASAVAVPTSGVAAIQVGTYEYYMYHRADGQMGYFLWSGSAWGYDALDASDLPGLISPTSGSRGELEGVSYSTSGVATPNVGWVMYRDAAGLLRGVWLAQGNSWHTATLSSVGMLGAPSAAYNPATHKLSVAFVDNNAHVRLATEGNPWTVTDYQASSTISLPLSNLGTPDVASGTTQASANVLLPNAIGGAASFTVTAAANGAADGPVGNATKFVLTAAVGITQATGMLPLANSAGSIQITAAAGTVTNGAAGNSIDIVLQAAGSTGISSFAGGVLTVDVANGTTVGDLAAVIHGDARFNATASSGSASTVAVGDLGTYTNILSGGASGTTSASYNVGTNTLTVTVAANATINNIAAAINALGEFSVSAITGGTSTFNFGETGTLNNAFSGGSIVYTPGAAVKPDLYYRSYTSDGVGAGMHVLYKDQSNHVLSLRAVGNAAAAFDSTAYMEGYHARFGYGIVNAAAAVGYALGSSTAVSGPGAGSWNLSLIRAPSVWTTATGLNTAVFSLDSGIDPNNADLLPLTGYNAAAGTSVTTDSNGHGTAMGGLIAGLNDGQGVTGVAYNARVVPVKIGDASVATEQAIVNGVNYAANYTLPAGYATSARIVNMSFASTSATMPTLRDTLYTKSPNTVFVSAAGNRTQNTPDTPAIYNVGFGIVAGAVNSASQLWSPSNGTAGGVVPYNYLLAPGVAVTAPTVVGTSGNSHFTKDIYGTSAAAAEISGVVALMLEANPLLTAREIESILISSADQVATQIASVSAPSISGVIYWAGSADSSAALAALSPATGSTAAVSAAPSTTVKAQSSAVATESAATTVASYDVVDQAIAAVAGEDTALSDDDYTDLFEASSANNASEHAMV